MAINPSREICLFGTDEKVESPRLLKAGPLSVEFEAGNLRYIRFHGVEMIRAISYIVRDRDWGTYNSKLSNLVIDENEADFFISYDAEVGDAEQIFRYSARIIGKEDGFLRFEGKGAGLSDFVTNRTGFVVLHPIVGVAGSPATVEHVDGRMIETFFPNLIDPVQPMMNLRAITHEFAQDVRVKCVMEGDAFEMEDQRNWTDASYKTYVRPLALPWPYTLSKGEVVEQAVSLTVHGQSMLASVSEHNRAVSIGIGAEEGAVPNFGAGLDVADCEAVAANLATLKFLMPNHILCHFDPRRGHSTESLREQVLIAQNLGAQPWLEAIIAKVDGWEDEVSALAKMVDELGRPFPVVMLSPASDLKCTLPGSVWPPCPPDVELFKHARSVFGNVKLVGGMFSFFTELNRKRPPLDMLDSVSFTTSAIVHAGDDRSVTESLESLPHIARSVRAIVHGKEWNVGPSAIGMRDNPYGATVVNNPNDIRQAMSRNDPRQRGLLAAVFDVGYFAHFAYGGASAIALGGLAGPFGTLPSKAPWKQPFFDENQGVYPVYHVRRALSSLAGGTLLATYVSTPRNVQIIAVKKGWGIELVLANLTDASVSIELSDLGSQARLRLLDEESFSEAANDPEFMMREGTFITGKIFSMPAYAIARLIF